jgi:hypothetical protein
MSGSNSTNSLKRNFFRTIIFLVFSAVAILSINEYRSEQKIKNERIALLQEQVLQYEEKLSTCVNSREFLALHTLNQVLVAAPLPREIQRGELRLALLKLTVS